MKKFRKENEKLVCEECHKLFKKVDGLSRHISNCHNKKHYYDKWLKEDNEGLCKICGKEAIFVNLNGYKKCCCKKHIDLYAYQCRKKYSLINFGVENPFQRKDCKEKIKQTNIIKLGVEYPSQSPIIRKKIIEICLQNWGVENVFQNETIKEKCKQTCLKNYSVEYPSQSKEIQEKQKSTCLKNFGVEYSFQSEEVKEKSKQTCLEHFDVEYNMQNPIIFVKAQKSRFKSKNFRDTNIYYRGTYEEDFVEKYHGRYPDMINAESIKYMFEGREHIYFPDFFIPSLNLIIEIKNSHLAERDKDKIEAKKNATIAAGFNYIMIMNKDYSNFEHHLM